MLYMLAGQSAEPNWLNVLRKLMGTLGVTQVKKKFLNKTAFPFWFKKGLMNRMKRKNEVSKVSFCISTVGKNSFESYRFLFIGFSVKKREYLEQETIFKWLEGIRE